MLRHLPTFLGFLAAWLSGIADLHAQPASFHGEAYKAAVNAIGSALDPGRRTMDRCIAGSGQIITDFPAYEGLPVKRCIYTEGGLTGLAYTLHPTKDQLAGWIGQACAQLPQAPQSDCGRKLFKVIWLSNNAQFVVAGNVIEDGKGSGCSSDSRRFNIQFRDGVTVGMPVANGHQMCWPQPRSIPQQEKDRQETNTLAYFVARVSTLDLATYERFTGAHVDRTTVRHPRRGLHPAAEWLRLSGADYRNAFCTGRSEFLKLVARSIYGASG